MATRVSIRAGGGSRGGISDDTQKRKRVFFDVNAVCMLHVTNKTPSHDQFIQNRPNSRQGVRSVRI